MASRHQKLSLCFDAEKTNSDDVTEPPGIYDLAQKNEQRDHAGAHAVAHGGGQCGQDKSPISTISTTHRFDRDIIFSRQYKQSAQYDESIHQHEKPLSNLLINLPPLLTPSTSSSSSDVYQHPRTHESNCLTTQQEADMGISDMGLPRGSLVNQQFGGSHSRQHQHQQQHVTKHNYGSSTSSPYNYQWSISCKTEKASSDIVYEPPRIYDLAQKNKHAVAHGTTTYCLNRQMSILQIMFIIILLGGYVCEAFAQPEKQNLTPSPLVNNTIDTAIQSPIMINNLSSPVNETNNTVQIETWLKKQRDLINHSSFVFFVMFVSLICSVHCLYIHCSNYDRIIDQWSTITCNSVMALALLLQLINEVWKGDDLAGICWYIMEVEFYFTSILLAIKYTLRYSQVELINFVRDVESYRHWELVFSISGFILGILSYSKIFKFIIAACNVVIIVKTFNRSPPFRDYDGTKVLKTIVFFTLKIQISIGTMIKLLCKSENIVWIINYTAILGIFRGIVFVIAFEHRRYREAERQANEQRNRVREMLPREIAHIRAAYAQRRAALLAQQVNP